MNSKVYIETFGCQMNVADTEELVKRHTDAPAVPVSVPASLARMLARVA